MAAIMQALVLFILIIGEDRLLSPSSSNGVVAFTEVHEGVNRVDRMPPPPAPILSHSPHYRRDVPVQPPEPPSEPPRPPPRPPSVNVLPPPVPPHMSPVWSSPPGPPPPLPGLSPAPPPLVGDFY
ncbi:leucine-rich repeat extensin-like protein 3 [Punica granatum]|uniref:Leucine-rich repeat extensin-like protein 3 n=1 Tax=Punica granatum TaxID=22663 RepID=A0A6P8E0U3_PUNGR|nr:leucine-rich repeat extensin-like protein 3 [Punica granatum]